MTEDIQLSFFGSITRVPADGALPVAEAFGHVFYLTALNHQEFNSRYGFCPAWMVKERKPAEPKKGAKKQPKTQPVLGNMSSSIKVAHMTFQYHVMGAIQTLRVPVKIYQLKPRERDLGSEDVVLSRPVIANQVVAFARFQPQQEPQEFVKLLGCLQVRYCSFGLLILLLLIFLLLLLPCLLLHLLFYLVKSACLGSMSPGRLRLRLRVRTSLVKLPSSCAHR